MKQKNLMEILHEDDDILIVHKASGILSIPDRYDKKLPDLFSKLSAKYGKVLVVHRLDRETSGVMMFAKNERAHRHLNTQFQEQKITKLYHAIVSGRVDRDQMTIDIPIIPHPHKKGKMIPSVRGKASLSELRVLERFRYSTFVEVNLITGRQHQLRVHCSAIGHPLLVDTLYGGAEHFMLSSIKRRFNLKKGSEELPVISRITMHAYQIAFLHPSSGEKMIFTADYPRDFAATLQLLRKYSESI